jgi:hypothetical protein
MEFVLAFAIRTLIRLFLQVSHPVLVLRCGRLEPGFIPLKSRKLTIRTKLRFGGFRLAIYMLLTVPGTPRFSEVNHSVRMLGILRILVSF